jgi:hypothetical protein
MGKIRQAGFSATCLKHHLALTGTRQEIAQHFKKGRCEPANLNAHHNHPVDKALTTKAPSHQEKDV